VQPAGAHPSSGDLPGHSSAAGCGTARPENHPSYLLPEDEGKRGAPPATPVATTRCEREPRVSHQPGSATAISASEQRRQEGRLSAGHGVRKNRFCMLM